MAYATVADVKARLGRFAGVLAAPASPDHPNEDDATQILADVSAELDLTFLSLGHDPGGFDATIQAGLKDVTAFGAIARLLAGVPADADLEKLVEFSNAVWRAAMGDPTSRQPDAIKGTIAIGTFPVVRALEAGEDGLGALAGDFWEDEPDYGTPGWLAVQRQLIATGAISVSLLPEFFKDMHG